MLVFSMWPVLLSLCAKGAWTSRLSAQTSAQITCMQRVLTDRALLPNKFPGVLGFFIGDAGLPGRLLA